MKSPKKVRKICKNLQKTGSCRFYLRNDSAFRGIVVFAWGFVGRASRPRPARWAGRSGSPGAGSSSGTPSPATSRASSTARHSTHQSARRPVASTPPTGLPIPPPDTVLVLALVLAMKRPPRYDFSISPYVFRTFLVPYSVQSSFFFVSCLPWWFSLTF